MKEGPSLIIIPEQRVWNCTSCKYYNYSMIKSETNPGYKSIDICLKLDYSGNPVSDGYYVLDYFSIGNETPNQCPFLQSAKRENKIKDLGI